MASDSAQTRGTRHALYGIFALSGATALAFETLWFRQAGLTFGNSVWASSLVLSSFMAGIALGNGFAARYAARTHRPIFVYAVLEFVIAATGVALVFLLPVITDVILPILRPFFDQPLVLNAIRLAIGFVILLAPATAMGATLPLVVRAMHARDPNFGSVLGRLYGVNTLGAMVGAIIGEAFVVEWLGIPGAGFVFGGLGVLAGIAALRLDRILPRIEPSSPATGPRGTKASLSLAAWGYLAAAFLAGGTLLAFEVVWFRFLHLFAHGGGLAFSLMLATVLLGIGLGGMLAGVWLRRDLAADRFASTVAFAAGCTSVLVYWGFEYVIDGYDNAYIRDAPSILWLTFCLTFLPSLLSGAIYTLVGAALEREVPLDSRATGLLNLFNTFGAGAGSIVGGFVLLPYLGMEKSFWLLASLYGGVGLLIILAAKRCGHRGGGILQWAVVGTFVAVVFLFPSGLMKDDYLQRTIKRYRGEMADVVAVREGVLQTNIYLRKSLDGEPLHVRLITDGYSMSGTADRNIRYMKLFVYWPVALRPDPKRALVISYGVGETAMALTDTKSLELIDVVDISPEILDASHILFPDPEDDPLRDPRVRVHTEDGRYFLKATEVGYDLITGEPPPPKMAGVVSLYTREYFELVRERLNPGGLNTYWLPAHNVTERDTKAIIRAYCDVFPDCALWSGSNLDWMLTGSNGYEGGVDAEAFSRQWRDPLIGQELRKLGIDAPELLGTLFLAGPERLRELTADTPPLVDDFPKRLSNKIAGPTIAQVYVPWMDATRAEERFRDSELIAKLWPESLRERTLAAFPYQRMLNETFRNYGVENPIEDLHRVLTQTDFRFLAIRLLETDGDRIRAIRNLVADGAQPSRYSLQLAIDALADRDYAKAESYFWQARTQRPKADRLFLLHLYAVCMMGDLERAQRIVTANRSVFGRSEESRELRPWFRNTFGLEF